MIQYTVCEGGWMSVRPFVLCGQQPMRRMPITFVRAGQTLDFNSAGLFFVELE